MSNLLKNIVRFIVFILVQAYVLDKVAPLHQFVKPILYFSLYFVAPL